MFGAVPLLFCFGFAFRRVMRCALRLTGLALLLRLLGPRLMHPLGDARRA